MPRTRSTRALGSLLTAVVCAACGQAATTELLQPGGVRDGGGGGPGDGGFRDTGVRDARIRDGGGDARDVGPRDRVVPVDVGPHGFSEEGRPCTPGSTDQGSCLNPMHVCMTWDPTGFDPSSTCIFAL